MNLTPARKLRNPVRRLEGAAASSDGVRFPLRPPHSALRLLLLLSGLFLAALNTPAAEHSSTTTNFPPALTSYPSPLDASLWEILAARVRAEPFNLVATLIFLLAIVHTFLAPRFLKWSRQLEKQHRERLQQRGTPPVGDGSRQEVSFLAEACHFLGEVEAIFGIWAVPLMAAICINKGWPTARDYFGHGLNFTEPVFVVVIMTIAASRPILFATERMMAAVAALGKGSPAAWWFSILLVGPVLGSFITEPAAMTISALLLAEKFYALRPTPKLAYATLGLLFVNISVGGTLTHFAAPPVLMVAPAWGWDMRHMLTYFGWKAVAGIVVANMVYFTSFHRELVGMESRPQAVPETGSSPGSNQPALHLSNQPRPVPAWIIGVHAFFLVWTVITNHFPQLFIGGFLFYLAFTHATEHHQTELELRPALLVGFFLAGLIVHGGLQGWWIAPVLSRLKESYLFFGAATLTAFNDNAAITYLTSLVPDFNSASQYAVMAGAVAGGGLTVIANAPNPAGQSILSKFFPEGISPLGLLLGALIPTAILSAAFLLL
jgi:hypothetical protein